MVSPLKIDKKSPAGPAGLFEIDQKYLFGAGPASRTEVGKKEKRKTGVYSHCSARFGLAKSSTGRE
jgi:hypothetical protein